MTIIVGLGNPGKKYALTRHNTGFLMLDKIQEAWDFPEFKLNKKFNAEISEGNSKFKIPASPARLAEAPTKRAGGQNSKFLLAKPQTFMNLSGEAVRAVLDFYKLTPDDLIVIHDDIDIALGKYKIAEDSRSAGHNGVQNIIDRVGTQKFRRIRIGVGNENFRSEVNPERFVLQKFSKEELEQIKKTSEDVLRELPALS